jgi:hypothetical protein
MGQVLVSTAYFPPAGYMASVIRSGHIIIEGWETYPKQTIRNHCHIYGPNGKQKLTIPVSRPYGNHTKTRDVLISDHEPWQRTHWRSIETAYRNSPFFLFYSDDFRIFFEKPVRYLIDFNTQLLQAIAQILRTEVTFTVSEKFELQPDPISDLRDNSTHLSDLQIFPRYIQPFESMHGFLPNLSILDIIFNLGPDSGSYLNTLPIR